MTRPEGSRRRRRRGPGRARLWPGRSWGAAVGVVADRWLGEPPVPGRLHPVALFGTAATLLERRLYADDRRRGAAFTAVTVGLAVGVGRLVDRSLAGRSRGAGSAASTAVAATDGRGRGAASAGATGGSPGVGRVVGASGVATYVACAGRGLHDAALEVGAALEAGRLDEARRLLPNLVGRDPASLDEAGIARAVVESVAENTTDAIVAPALWAAVAGPPGALLHRAADTLDSMVGYRDARYHRFGTAAARLDDVLAWVPARVTAALVALARPRRATEVWRIVRRDGTAHPSPNAGIAEAAFAAALDVRLGGTNRYGEIVEHRPVMGDGRPAGPADISRAVALSRRLTWTLAALLATAAAAGAAATTRSRTRRSH